MPVYVYECRICGVQVEKQFSIVDAPKEIYLAHGTGKCDESLVEPVMKRIIAPTSFILKGPGWAKDGYSK